MKARRHVEFTGVELADDAELAAPVEKDATSLVEKTAAGPQALKSPRHVRGAVEREEDRLMCSGAVEMPASRAERRWRVRSLRRHGCAVERGRRGGGGVRRHFMR
jgi:hypothetical protein